MLAMAPKKIIQTMAKSAAGKNKGKGGVPKAKAKPLASKRGIPKGKAKAKAGARTSELQ